MISIIVPAYNSEKNIEVCIKSLMRQTYEDIEIIVVDDGSLDKTDLITNSLSKVDQRIIVVHKENGGVSSARNIGITKATGEFIMFVDSDDEVKPNYCEEMLKVMQHSNADLIVCGYEIKKDNKDSKVILPSKYDSINVLSSKEAFLELYLNSRTCICVPWNKMYKREKVSIYFDEKSSWGEDLIFNINYLQNIESVAIIGKSLYYYNVNNNGSSLNKNGDQIIKNLKKNLDFVIQYSCVDDICMLQKMYEQYYYEFFYYCKLLCRTNYKKIRKFCIDLLETGDYQYIVDNVIPTSAKAKLLRFSLKKRFYFIIYIIILIQQVFTRRSNS